MAPAGGHGTYARWRYGCRCDDCCTAHRVDQQRRKYAAAVARWATLAPQLFELLAAGTPYGGAVEAIGATPQAVTAYRHRDPAFAARLDEALTRGRNPDVAHGSHVGWRTGCRCPECRSHHEAHRPAS